MTEKFATFLAVGAAAAALNIVARIVFELAVPFDAAVVLAYLVGMTAAFFLNKFFVFGRSSAPVAVQYGRFCVVNAFALAQVWLVSVGLERLLFPAIGLTWHSQLLAHVIGVATPVVSSYIGHRDYSFR
ncbi:GtrA family protein [Rhodopseudomonas rhenobacensis]|uniref:GtrA family protein n=1 Tax=Rhodopseudomonas rhenobacensis TaxID=87461 RepID=UPI001616EC76